MKTRRLMKRSVRGLTLVEVMTTLMILALISTATTSMLASAAKTQRYVLTNTVAVSECELAFRRIVENLRSASQAAIISPTELTLVTQPDTDNPGNPVYNVSYTLIGSRLFENDDRFGSNILTNNVIRFRISTVQTTKPTVYFVELDVNGDAGVIKRKAFITSRNF